MDFGKDEKLVRHPDHYKSSSGLEAMDVIEAFTEHLTGIEAVNTGNILKYAMRWKKKDGVKDLKKIIVYAEELVKRIEKKKPEEVENNHVQT